MDVPLVYDLTPMTRHADSKRQIVVKGFDLPKRGLAIFTLALIPAIIVAAILWPLLGANALIALVVVELAAFWLFEGRSRSGMRLRNYQSILDSRRTKDGQFFVCGQPIEPRASELTYVRTVTRPVERPRRDVADIFGFAPAPAGAAAGAVKGEQW